MNYLVVCTGNICRSPMAEAILRDRLPPGNQVRSAGVLPQTGCEASDEARAALAEIGLESFSRAAPVDDELVDWADLILCMEYRHRDAIVARFPRADGKTMLLGKWAGEAEREIPDPYGGSLDDYRQTRDEILELVGKAVDQ